MEYFLDQGKLLCIWIVLYKTISVCHKIVLDIDNKSFMKNINVDLQKTNKQKTSRLRAIWSLSFY